MISRKRTTLAARRALLVEREAKLLELMNEAEEYINSIEKSELRMMFEFYYIDDLTWCQVAQRMNHAFPKRRIKYTEDNCRMRHNRFLDENEKDLKKYKMFGSCSPKICFKCKLSKERKKHYFPKPQKGSLIQTVSDCRQSPAFAGFCYFVGTAFLI
mgnify:CR=1 FL=1